MAETVYILMGSNMGDREKNLSAALARLETVPGLEIVAISGIYVSEAKDMEGDTPPFMNQVVMGDYQYLPNELLDALELIEKKLGRSGKGKRQQRTIDLDILLFGDQIIENERLSIPHRELLNRPFAMLPLLQIDPNIIHPVTKRPVAEFLTEGDRQKVLLYKDHVARNV
ncbi:MAG: 2-amino-4-hydroxy-6-hydroxymethyldihydropteridine diphosphokinase [Candidatus Zixiibacteriota bacterium]